jgi:hypothetical protein
MLTTEAVPTRIIETINRESAKQGDLQEDRFKIYDFDLPDSARDTVTIELQRACKKESESCGISNQGSPPNLG